MAEDIIEQISQRYRDEITRLSFFDANVWLGHPEGFPLAEELDVAQLPGMFEGNFITGGLVSHWRGKILAAQDGNSALEVPLPPNVFTIWTGLPLFPAEPGPLPGQENCSERVRGVRIFPKSHNFPLTPWAVGTLCEWMVQHRMPLFIWHTELDWPSLHALGKAFPRLTVVLETQPRKILYQTRPLFALMQDCENICIELSNFAGANFVEYAVREFGPERLIFGSFATMNDPYVPMGMILEAQIGKEEKKKIAGDNLRRLISEVQL